jgi:phage host-nuclease inhibitor protein Gam
MDPKVILVIALLGVASLDWLASAEQDDESPNRTLDEAKNALKDRSLTPEQVTKILKRLEGHWKIDGFYVSSLLWLDRIRPCAFWAQEFRERTCYHLSTPSVKNFCDHIVQQSKDNCRAQPVLALKQNIQIAPSVVNSMSEMEAARRGQDVDKFDKDWVAGLGKGEQLPLKEQCRRFLSAEKKMARLFGIDVGEVARGLNEGHRLKYLHYANIHCKTIVEIVESASEEEATSELTLEEAKRTLSDPSLQPTEVGQILERLDEDLQIDGVRVGQLLWPNHILRCDVQHQEQREKSCHVIETPSLKEYCESLVKRVIDYCKAHPEEALAIYVKYDLKDIVNESRPAVHAMATVWNLAHAIYLSVDKLKSQKLRLSERKCRTFGEQMKQSFGIELNAVKDILRDPEEQLRYAIAYCETVIEVSKKRRIEEKLKNTKLEPEKVGEILVRLDKNLMIEGVRVGELLWPERDRCNVENQERRVENCKRMTRPLKNYCEDLVKRVNQYCHEDETLVLSTYASPGLKEIAQEFNSVAIYARESDESVQRAFERWVDGKTPDEQSLVATECGAFYEHDRKVKELFGIDIMKIIHYHSGYNYLGYANSYCVTAVSAVEGALRKTTQKAAENERRHKSVLQKLRGCFGCR